jgi:hypothetical protein
MLQSQPHSVEKKCPRCGQVFGCVVQDNCWCDENINLSRETLKLIRLNYLDCLCKECLLFFMELEKHGGRAA